MHPYVLHARFVSARLPVPEQGGLRIPAAVLRFGKVLDHIGIGQ